jgi:hypothetical protein
MLMDKKLSTECKKPQCPDCDYCQICSENRCRLCRDDQAVKKKPVLGTSFTYGQYMEWKRDIRYEDSGY